MNAHMAHDLMLCAAGDAADGSAIGGLILLFLIFCALGAIWDALKKAFGPSVYDVTSTTRGTITKR